MKPRKLAARIAVLAIAVLVAAAPVSAAPGEKPADPQEAGEQNQDHVVGEEMC